MVFGVFRALSIYRVLTEAFKVESPPTSIFSFIKVEDTILCKKQFYAQRWSSSVTENTQDLQELCLERSRQTLEPKLSLHMMKSKDISPQSTKVLFHCHLGGGIFLAEQNSTL